MKDDILFLSALCRYMQDNVVHVLAIVKSGLDQRLSSKRPRSGFGPLVNVLIAGRASPCSPLLTLQVAAEAVVAWSPCGGCCFRFFVNVSQTSVRMIRIDTYQSDQMFQPQ